VIAARPGGCRLLSGCRHQPRFETIFLIRPDCRLESEQLDSGTRGFAVRGSSCAPHFLGLDADRWPAFFVADALVQIFQINDTAMGDGADRLGMAEARDDPAIHDGEDRPFAFTAALAA
jgi:hypothetical protein